MSLKEQLLNDLKIAMKEKDSLKKSTITMVRAAILQIEKDKKIELAENDILEVVAKQVKQRRDSLKDFEKAQREDLIEQTKKEIEVLQHYLPQQLSEEELKKIVTDTINEVGATSMKNMGQVMAAIMPKVKGRADGSIINRLVKEILQ